jgi:hypothetical protein
MLKSKVEIETLFDGDDKLFKSYLKNCKLYFEYGVGASTRWVLANSNSNIIAVDTDKEWIDYVNIKVSNMRVNLIWVNLGDLTKWGRPNSYKYRNSFIDYVSGVWNFKKQADVILIDGRFRVACFLYSLLHSKTGSVIIFDDYFDRSWYHIIEEVISLHDKCGRQAIFKVPKVYDKKLTLDLLNKFLYVFD